MNILFICSRNKWRSPTGESIFRRYHGVATRSAGTSDKARRQVNLSDIQWADLIFVMEEKHSARLRAKFRNDIALKDVHILDIPDDFGFMDPELVDMITEIVTPIIDAAILDK